MNQFATLLNHPVLGFTPLGMVPWRFILGRQTISEYVKEQHAERPWHSRWFLLNEAIELRAYCIKQEIR